MSKVAWIKKPVHMPRLRKQLFGEDRLPGPSEEKYMRCELFTSGGWMDGDSLGFFDLKLVPQGESPVFYPFNGKPKHRSAHRLFAHCPKCDKFIPVGRMAQHKH